MESIYEHNTLMNMNSLANLFNLREDITLNLIICTAEHNNIGLYQLNLPSNKRGKFTGMGVKRLFIGSSSARSLSNIYVRNTLHCTFFM